MKALLIVALVSAFVFGAIYVGSSSPGGDEASASEFPPTADSGPINGQRPVPGTERQLAGADEEGKPQLRSELSGAPVNWDPPPQIEEEEEDPYGWMETATPADLQYFIDETNKEFLASVEGKFDSYYDTGRYEVVENFPSKFPKIVDGKALPNCIRIVDGEMRLVHLTDLEAPHATRLFTEMHQARKMLQRASIR